MVFAHNSQMCIRDSYQTVRLWYEEEMNKSVIAGTIVEEGEKTLQNFSAQVGETIENLGKKVLV